MVAPTRGQQVEQGVGGVSCDDLDHHQAALALTFPTDQAEFGGVDTESGGSLLNASHVTPNLIRPLFQPFPRP